MVTTKTDLTAARARLVTSRKTLTTAVTFSRVALLRGLVLGVLGCATQQAESQAQPLRGSVGPYDVTVLMDGAPVPTFTHQGETYVMGALGARYTLRVTNRSGRRVEAVVSVDGRDVCDGKPADVRKRGYLVPAWGSVDIDGWRLSAHQAAAFRFSSVPDSYAARTGSARNVGVIGVAIFPERTFVRPPQPIYPRYRHPTHNQGDDGLGYGGPPAAAPMAEFKSAAPTGAPKSKAESGEHAENEAQADRFSLGGVARGGASLEPSRRRPGLGTEFGEAVDSRIREVAFVRANANTPAVTLGLRYNDHDGLLAAGIDVDGWYRVDDQELRRTATPFPVSTRRYAQPPEGWRR